MACTKSLSKTKTSSLPLSKEEIADINEARIQKGKIHDDVEKLIKDLHCNK